MKKNTRTTLKAISIILTSTAIAQRLNSVIINIAKGSEASARNIDAIYIVEAIALVIAIVGIATNNRKRTFFGFGGYYMIAICGMIMQMLREGQIMEIADKVHLLIDFVIVIVLGLAAAKAIKPFTTAVVVEIMIIAELVINISQIFPSSGTIFETVQALTNAMVMFAVGKSIVITCDLINKNQSKERKPQKEIA